MADQLIITFLYGEFHAKVVADRAIAGEWTPGAKDRSHGWHEGAFRYYLERAVEETGYQGRDVVLVVEDPDLEHQQVTLPPVKKRSSLIRLLEHEVNRNAGEEPVAWSHTELSVDKESPGDSDRRHYLLHVWPRYKLNRYLDDLDYMGLAPRLILPLTSLLLSRMERINQRKRPAALLQRFGYGAILLIQDVALPQVLLRHLTGGLGRGAGRIVQEIRRSILYANQNLALQPVVLWLDDKNLFLDAQAGLEIAVKEAEVLDISADVALPASRVPTSATVNLVPLDIRDKRRARLLRQAVNYCTGLVVTAALTIVGLSQWELYQVRNEIRQVEQHLGLQEQERLDLERELQRLRDRGSMMDFATGEKQPVIEWFLRDLSRSAPKQIVVTELRLEKTDERFAELSMVAELNASDISELDRVLLDYGKALQGQPWFVELPADWAELWRSNYMSGAMASGTHKVSLKIEGRLPW